MVKRIFVYFAAAVFGVAVLAADNISDANSAAVVQKYVQVKAKNRNTPEWRIQDTRIVSLLEGLKRQTVLYSKYGGRLDRRFEAKGFFYTKKVDGRWWLVDPEGCAFYSVGVNSVYRGVTEQGQKASVSRFGSNEEWAQACIKLLGDYGFNTAGGWSEGAILRASSLPVAYTLSWDFMGEFAKKKKLATKEPTHHTYVNDCIPVFHPEFEKFCDEYGRQLAGPSGDAYLIGHFSDNELPCPPDFLDRSLNFDANNPELKYGYEAARAWLSGRKGGRAEVNSITDEDRKAFVEYAFERYYRLTTGAIRKYDPNHLCLGSRIYGKSLVEGVFRASGRYLDVVSVNYYGAWALAQDRMTMWGGAAGKPFLISEFSGRGMDSGIKSPPGYAWVVETQRERGLYYQHFSLALLEAKDCVGWHWFKFRDGNTEDGMTESDVGLVDVNYRAYLPMFGGMYNLNDNVYGLIDYFDGREKTEVKEADGEELVKVRVKRKPEENWTEYSARTVDYLKASGLRDKKVELSKYGGWLEKKMEASGFFRTAKINDRWWLVDPDGYLFVHIGVASVYRGLTPASLKTTEGRFGTAEKWAEYTVSLLSENGFNGTGGWSDTQYLRASSHPLAYTLLWDFCGEFGKAKKLVTQGVGHLEYPNRCIPVFHPEFASFCDEYGKRLEATRDDPYLVGHFSDNELTAQPDMLEQSFKLDVDNPDLRYGYEAAKEWLVRRNGSADINNITDADRMAFLGYVYETYYRITNSAIRKYDPHHLFFGTRLYGKALRSEELFRSSGRYVDVISVNYYGLWDPNLNRMKMWGRESGRPVVITEFYAKGEDSGFSNRAGAGWLVPTQRDRGLFYQNFTIGLLESKNCVGWHWFKYRDDNPDDPNVIAGNLNANKGIVNYKYEPYNDLLAEMKKLNNEVYNIISCLDAAK